MSTSAPTPEPDPGVVTAPEATSGGPGRLVAVTTSALHAVAVVASLTVAVVIVGVPLAVAGRFTPVLLGVGVVPVTVLVHRALGPLVAREPTDRRTAAALLVALVVVGAAGIADLRHAGQHHATERDPGVYLETGLWLAGDGGLLVQGRSGPFLADDFVGAGAGFVERHDGSGRLEPQFPHATAVLVAVGGWLGPAAATRVVPALAAVALALWAILFSRLVPPWWATVAVVVVATNVAVFHFARDTFSEPVAALLLALVVLGLGDDRVGSWAGAGLALGAALAVRIDVVVVVVAVAGGLVVRAVRGGDRRHGTALVLAAVPGGVVAGVDLVTRSPAYLADKWGAVRPALELTPVLLALAGVGTAVVGTRIHTRVRGYAGRVIGPPGNRRRRVAAAALVSVVVAAVAWALFVRPGTVTMRGGVNGHVAGLQARDGLVVDATRTYGEQTLVWLTWYFGVPLVVLAVVGVAVHLWRSVVGGATSPLVGSVAVVMGLPSLLYLADPHISGDQIWAMRRFVPLTVPLLAVSAAAGAEALVALVGRLVGPAGRAPRGAERVTAVVLAALMVVPGLVVSVPLAGDRTLLWPTYALDGLCRALPDDAAVLVDRDRLLGEHLLRPLARSCGVPAAMGDVATVDLVALDRAWRAEGRRLVVVHDALVPVPDLVVDARVVLPVRQLEAAVERRPTRIEQGDRVVLVARPVGVDRR